MKTVAILGCGPSALLSAWGVEQAGHRPHIISPGEKSVIPGSQHLHGPVPGLTSQYPEGTIQFVRLGTAEGYAEKVYGDPERQTGWENYLQVFPSWNIIKAYDKLWDWFMADVSLMLSPPDRIPRDGVVARTHEIISGEDHERMNEILNGHDLVISTIPARALCYQAHDFVSVPYIIRQLDTPPADEDHEIVVYNGLPHDAWYRWSILAGLCSIEYMHQPGSGPSSRDTIGFKAVSNNCDCWPTIERCGRWAEHRHGVTMYQAYQKAAALAEAL